MSVSINEVANKFSKLPLNFSVNNPTGAKANDGSSWHNNVEYVWIDDISSVKLLSKTQKVRESKRIDRIDIEDIPKSIYNIKTHYVNWRDRDTGVLNPVLLCKDPFRPEKDYECNGLILCEPFLSNSEPTTSAENRIECKETMMSRDEWQFEIEQEFSFQEIPEITSIAEKDCIRKTLDSFNRACIYAGISINSFSIENHRKDFLSYKIGPCDGLRVSDELWMSRYILQRVAEEFHLTPSFDPIKDGDQVRDPRALYSFSAGEMFDDKGMQLAKTVISKMKLRHVYDLDSYNRTSDFTKDDLWEYNTMGEFSEVVTIPRNTEKDGRVWIVDLRPRGNSDPYVVTKTIITTLCS